MLSLIVLIILSNGINYIKRYVRFLSSWS
jgi:hypothetical protein